MRVPRPKDVVGFWWGVGFLAAGLLGVLGRHSDRETPYVFLAIGAAHVVRSFVVKPAVAPEPRPSGPGTLTPTGTGRFRATGWPPSKDPDDYR